MRKLCNANTLQENKITIQCSYKHSNNKYIRIYMYIQNVFDIKYLDTYILVLMQYRKQFHLKITFDTYTNIITFNALLFSLYIEKK